MENNITLETMKEQIVDDLTKLADNGICKFYDEGWEKSEIADYLCVSEEFIDAIAEDNYETIDKLSDENDYMGCEKLTAVIHNAVGFMMEQEMTMNEICDYLYTDNQLLEAVENNEFENIYNQIYVYEKQANEQLQKLEQEEVERE